MRAAAALLLLAALPCAVRADDAAVPSQDFALSGCRVVTAAGDDIPDGVVVVRKGAITAVGPRGDTDVPRGVRVVPADGGVVTPAFVHVATRLGLRGSGGGDENAVLPDRSVADELNPWLDANRWSAAAGFGTLGLLPGRGIVGGRGVAVRSAADDIDSMSRNDDSVLRIDVTQGSRFVGTLSGQLAAARKDLDGKAKWDRDHAEWKEQKAKAEAEKKKPPDEPKEPKLDPKREALRKVLRGETALLCLVGSSSDVVSLAEALADESVRGDALRLYCVLSGDAFRAAPELLDLGATCVVRATLDSWPNTDQTVCPAVHLRNAGLDVVLMPRDDARDGLRSYPFDLAQVVASGFPRDAVWPAATAAAAKLLGVGKKIGTIEVERRADLILWSGDPLLATSRIRHVWVDGDAVEDTP